MSMEEDIKKANIELGKKVIAYPILIKACQRAEDGLLDALHALNDLGESCPSSVHSALQEINKVFKRVKRND